MRKKLLQFAAAVEIATGFALIVESSIVIALLIAGNEPPEAMPLARVAGIAMLALGLACWPTLSDVGSSSQAFRGMLAYNGLIALYLLYLFTVEHMGGLLLWPAVVLHAAVAILLVKTRRDEQPVGATGA